MLSNWIYFGLLLITLVLSFEVYLNRFTGMEWKYEMGTLQNVPNLIFWKDPWEFCVTAQEHDLKVFFWHDHRLGLWFCSNIQYLLACSLWFNRIESRRFTGDKSDVLHNLQCSNCTGRDVVIGLKFAWRSRFCNKLKWQVCAHGLVLFLEPYKNNLFIRRM